MLLFLLKSLHVLVCAILIFVVLLQQGRGGGMGATFGGGGATQVFGGRGAGNLLTRTTSICAGLFMLTSVSLAYKSSEGDRELKQRAAQEAKKSHGDKGTARPKDSAAAGAPSGAAPTDKPADTAPADSTAPATPANPATAQPRDSRQRARALSDREVVSTSPRARARAVRAAAALVLAKAAIALAVLAFGFTHVSDDDYARVVIAQGFAVAPRLDPSGTSWLPLPFWVTGGAMIVTGRSLLAARIVAVIVGALGPLPAFFALRRSGVGMTAILVGLVLAFASPWSAWSAAATIPDGWTAALVAAAAFGLMAQDDEVRGVRLAASCAAAAALARYEAWPLCAVVAARATVLLVRRRDLARQLAPALVLALAAPLAWMAWNLHAHGDPLHFLARVASFRRQLGAASVPLATKLAEYPRALWDDAPDALFLGAVGAAGLFASPPELRARLRSRWCWPVLAAAAITVFLVVGDVRDGAPTHHPVRPLLGVVAILVVWGVDTLALLLPLLAALPPRRAVQPLVALLVAAALVRDLRAYQDPPGTGEADRAVQIERGTELHATTGPVDVLHVTPCAYEHFALLASFAAPERAVVEAARPPSAEEECPRVTVEAR